MNNLNKIKEQFKETLDAKLDAKEKQIASLQQQLNTEVQDKNDYHAIC